MREEINWKEIIKEGNIVKVRQWDDMEKQYGYRYVGDAKVINVYMSFTEDMKKICGDVINIDEEIEKNYKKRGYFYYQGFSISTDMLEPYEEELDVINIPVKDEYLKDLHEEKYEKEIITPNIENHGIKENAIYVIEYNDTEGKTFLGGDNFITFKGRIINFTNDKCFIIDQEKGLAILNVKNIISMIPIKIN